MIEAEEINTTHIKFGGLDVLCLLKQTAGELIVQLDITQLEEGAVALPESAGLIVVGIAFRAQARELGIRIRIAGSPTSIVILL